jgi:hypothetical protein
MDNRYVIGDIHGCAAELERLVGVISKATEIYAVGDLFDRGFYAYRVWRLIHEYGIKAVKGNHEAKMLSFLTGERDHLPPHYYYAIDQLFESGVSRKELIDYLSGLPTMIELSAETEEYVIVHAGVNPSCLYDRSDSATVYGVFDPRPWWEDYKGAVGIVVYGHLSQPYPDTMEPRLRMDGGVVSSIGIDTAAVSGVALCAYGLDNQEFHRVRSKWNYSEMLRADLKMRGKSWAKGMRESLRA